MAASSSRPTAVFSSSSSIGLRLTAALLAASGAFIAPSAASAEDCAAARKAVEQAQQVLSKATRDADTLADSYGQCMQKGGSCAPKKAAFDAALAAKAKAAAALKAATTRRQSACN